MPDDYSPMHGGTEEGPASEQNLVHSQSGKSRPPSKGSPMLKVTLVAARLPTGMDCEGHEVSFALLFGDEAEVKKGEEKGLGGGFAKKLFGGGGDKDDAKSGKLGNFRQTKKKTAPSKAKLEAGDEVDFGQCFYFELDEAQAAVAASATGPAAVAPEPSDGDHVAIAVAADGEHHEPPLPPAAGSPEARFFLRVIARRKRDLGDHVTVATLDAFPFAFGPREFEHGGWHDLCGEEEDKDYGEVGRSVARSTGDSLVTHLVCVLRRDPADATWADATETEVARWRRPHQERFVWVGETITPRTGDGRVATPRET